ncbi:Z1 domain-containing protein [Euzebya tangerina]|uniref:Z1 domain-containing protein n=1 Tax=Euzebya tangerina TaxID=591198 RepID=UPI000E317FB4|nr:Z1 domain-containing protein [Euzebya tangerina]
MSHQSTTTWGKIMQPTDLNRWLMKYQKYLVMMGAEDARISLADDGWTQERIDIVAAEHTRRIGAVTLSGGLVASEVKGWIDGSMLVDSARPRWVFTRGRLNVPDDALPIIDRTTDEILAKMPDPKQPEIFGRGLVVGYVQSGKTTSFTALAAKAADAGYDLIVVLAGIHTSLRRQTQERVQADLWHKDAMWWTATGVSDFEPRGGGTSLRSRMYGNGKRGLLVVKKNTTRLKNLADWLWSAGPGERAKLSVLVIDDEADQAGLDVSPGPELAGVHEQLMRIVNLGDGPNEQDRGNLRCAYVGYTATPYANVLTRVEEENLYPRHFIYPLPKPDGHVGAAELFGEAVVGSPVRDVTTAPKLESGGAAGADLEAAIDWFVCATAARAVIAGGVDRFNSTMLIHTGMTVDEHRAARDLVEAYLLQLRQRLAEAAGRGAFKHFYEQEASRVNAAEIGETTISWKELSPHVDTVLHHLIDRTDAGKRFKEDGRWQRAHSGVIIDNSQEDSEDRLTYGATDRDESGVTVIAIGGNTLSRGLTLEGLCVSFFARTSGNYDSLMQMGRWFGFRPGYRHLTRLWTTSELRRRFRRLTEVEDRFRQELVAMIDQGLSPSDYGPRIMLDPDMQVTRPNAIRAAMRSSTWAGYTASMTTLLLDDPSLIANQKAVRRLVAALDDPVALDGGPSLIETHVSGQMIIDLLRSLRIHPDDYRMNTQQMIAYIAQAGLDDWNVVLRSVGGSPSTFDLGESVGEIGTVVRSKVDNGLAGGAYIQTLLDKGDAVIDLRSPRSDGKRDQGDPPLLLIYCIDGTSSPQRGGRAKLGATMTVPAVGLSFPVSDEPATIQWTGAPA